MGRAFEYRKATKFARWDKMAKQFSKAGRQITIAVKNGGPDPEANILLKRAIQNAKSVQMPKDKIEAAIKKAADKDTSGYDEVTYEGMAPHGVAVIIETATDNPTRTVANVRASFNKKGGALGTSGMHDFIFDRKGVFYLQEDQIDDPEEAELTLIDFGLEKLEKENTEDGIFYKIYVAFPDFGAMQSGLDENGFNVEKSELERIPSFTKSLSEDQIDEVLDLIDRLEQDDDVQNVFHNLE
ncbi:YebC/PmpR family DNA-binding transcriptional regulator [Membranihabitans maritimus]|uniref:YebC/PmpR family DNA-binding transcriptional regulator n=1 Tax=Membranihabitans maritimus TaxID=2904244 RepID=UPI001F2903EE|nr:YebC/PmpR family DNA-binding transcriptional regulator [Membranihabitans maritimus]